jgi:hypothetical protein
LELKGAHKKISLTVLINIMCEAYAFANKTVLYVHKSVYLHAFKLHAYVYVCAKYSLIYFFITEIKRAVEVTTTAAIKKLGGFGK